MADQDTFLNGIEILDTTNATSLTASLYTIGGISILSTVDSTDLNNGGSFLTLGGISIAKSTLLGGITRILNTSSSTNTSTGSLIVNGGMGIQGNVNGNIANFTFITVPNIIASNITVGTLLATSFSPSAITTGNLFVTGGSVLTNTTITNLSVGNTVIINANITSLTAGSLALTNLSTVNQTVNSLVVTNTNTTNLTVGNLLLSNLSVTNQTVTNLLFTNASGANVSISGTSNFAGAIFSGFPSISGAWLNLPIGPGFASGVGTGGPGANPFFAYAGNPGFWFIDSVTGDNAYRNTIGRLLFGNSTGRYTMGISNYIVTIQSTVDSINTSSGALVITNGGAGIFGDVNIGGNIMIYSTVDSSSVSSGSIVTLGGLGVAKSVDIGSTNNSINVSTGALTVSGGAGFNGDVYCNNLYAMGTSGSVSMFGSEFNVVELAATAGTTSRTYQLRTALTTSSLFGGNYNITMRYSLFAGSTTSQNSEFLVILDGTGISTGTIIHTGIVRPSSTAQILAQYDLNYTPLSAGIHTIGLWYRTQSNGSITNIANTALQVYRVN